MSERRMRKRVQQSNRTDDRQDHHRKEVKMTKVHTWMMTGLAAVALAVGVLMASGALTSAQSPTPAPTDEATEGDSTPTPAPSEDSDDSSDTEDEDAGSEESDSEGSEDRRGCGGGKYLVKEAAAEVLGLSEEELREALRDGQSLAQIAEAQGMTVEDFTSALQANITAALQAQLDAGEITQEEFDEITSELNERLDEIINAEGGLRFRGGFDGDGDGADGTGARFRNPFRATPAGSGA
jgi:hypothetical protein